MIQSWSLFSDWLKFIKEPKKIFEYYKPDEKLVKNCNLNKIIWIPTDGHIRRGCTSDLDQATRANCNTPTCTICQGTNQGRNDSNCNVGVFPIGRIQCVICNGNTTCAGNSDLPPQYCARFVENDQCFTRRPDNSTYERGCRSSITECDASNCMTCQGDGCNHRDFTGASFKITVNLMLIVTAILATILANN
jgi:hypothetical protein